MLSLFPASVFSLGDFAMVRIDSALFLRRWLFASCVALVVLPALSFDPALAAEATEADEEGWISLFNGQDLEGWQANENKETFSVENGAIKVAGPRSHLYYVGRVHEANFKNFHWKCEIMTKPKANSGMYFHTKFQREGWPSTGYEVQVNNTHGDPKKTGGLYAIKDVMNQSPAKDDEWFTQEVIVNGKQVTIKVNGKTTTEYTEPENAERPAEMKDRLLSSGTIALQGHDPGSVIYYRKVMIKPLP